MADIETVQAPKTDVADVPLARLISGRGTSMKLKQKRNPRDPLLHLLGKAGVTADDLKAYRAEMLAGSLEVQEALAAEAAGEAERNKGPAEYLEHHRYLLESRVQPSARRFLPVDRAVGYPLVPTSAPPPPRPFPTDDGYRDCRVVARGTGDGWEWWGFDDDTDVEGCTFEIETSFVPALTTDYTIKAGALCAGWYHLVANDKAWNSMQAEVSVKAYLGITQKFVSPIHIAPGVVISQLDDWVGETLFEHGDDNIAEYGQILGAALLEKKMLLWAGVPAKIQVTIITRAEARGEGSVATLDCQRPDGGLYFSGVWIE
jgi:hypothetical protein